MTERELLEFKEEIEEVKNEISKLEGRKSTLLEQLKKDWKCDSLKDAKTLLARKKKRQDVLKKRIEELETEIENKYFV